MKLVQCPNGHYYNQEINTCCPVCGKNPGEVFSSELKIMQGPRESSVEDVTVSIDADSAGSEDVTVSIFDANDFSGDDSSMTVMMVDDGKAWSPVVGWIVCVEGTSIGRDYRLHSQRNFIGRAGDMDVSVFEDEKIAMRSHCSIVHEPVKNEFMLVPGKDTATIYNGKQLEKYVKLAEGDRFKIGESTFAFVPFCKGDVIW